MGAAGTTVPAATSSSSSSSSSRCETSDCCSQYDVYSTTLDGSMLDFDGENDYEECMRLERKKICRWQEGYVGGSCIPWAEAVASGVATEPQTLNQQLTSLFT